MYMVCQITEVSIVRLVMMNVSKCGLFINNVGFGWYERFYIVYRMACSNTRDIPTLTALA